MLEVACISVLQNCGKLPELLTNKDGRHEILSVLRASLSIFWIRYSVIQINGSLTCRQNFSPTFKCVKPCFVFYMLHFVTCAIMSRLRLFLKISVSESLSVYCLPKTLHFTAQLKEGKQKSEHKLTPENVCPQSGSNFN